MENIEEYCSVIQDTEGMQAGELDAISFGKDDLEMMHNSWKKSKTALSILETDQGRKAMGLWEICEQIIKMNSQRVVGEPQKVLGPNSKQ